MTTPEGSYGPRVSGDVGPIAGIGQAPVEGLEYWPLEKCRRAYTDYLFAKREEIDEQIEARRYYHGSQYTSEQRRILKKRNQPIMTFNRIARKVDAVIGLLEKLRQAPKGSPRTPQHEQGAELGTAALRYVLDEQAWREKSPWVGTDAAIDGIGGIEITLEKGDRGDIEIGFDDVDIQSFFYDPRSYKEDFSDARYMGLARWVDVDIAKETFPKADPDVFISDPELTTTSDREMRWFQTQGIQDRTRIVEIWYKQHGEWCYCIFTGAGKITEGRSPFKDEKKRSTCKYIMFSGSVDQDGDRYGFVRNLKSPQDGINAKQSKMQHILHSKRLILSQGAVDDIEKTRAEWARPDGVIVTNRPVGEGVRTDDQSFDFSGLARLLELNLNEIENFGPNPALIGQGMEGQSGRAIALLQQAGIAELGPFILGYRGWKLRSYRALWNAIQQFWQAERWIRVTDDEGLAQFIQVNKLGLGPDGFPTIINAIGSLDVDIVLDEAPDAVTLQAQSFDVLQALGPQFMMQFPDIAIELSPLDSATKKQIRDRKQQAQQGQQPQQQLAMAAGQADVENKQADTQLKLAQAGKATIDVHMGPVTAALKQTGSSTPEPVPPQIQTMQALADIEETQATADNKRATAAKTIQDMMLAPLMAAGMGSQPER